MSEQSKNILYCHCSYAKVVPADIKQQVLQGLTESGVAFDAVADLCEMSANKDPALKQLAGQDELQIAACYPRAVKWLFSAADAPLPDGSYEVQNMRTDPAEQVVSSLLNTPAEADEESSS